jgi:lipid-A-disaccharide synthase
VALVLAVLPFERGFYAAAGVPVEYVGHPLLDLLQDPPDRSAARRRLGLDGRGPVIGLLPGSREHEVARLLPVMHGAASRIAAAEPAVRFVLGLAPSLDATRIRHQLASPPAVELVPGGAHLVMCASDLLLVASGTATLEAALLDTPMVVCYRLSALSEWVGRLVVRVPWISLPNLILGRAVVPEIWRGTDVTSERLAAEALRLLKVPGTQELQREAFAELRRLLGPPGVAVRAARWVLEQAAARAPSTAMGRA